MFFFINIYVCYIDLFLFFCYLVFSSEKERMSNHYDIFPFLSSSSSSSLICDGTHCLYMYGTQRAHFFFSSILSRYSVSRGKEREGEYGINILDNTYVEFFLLLSLLIKQGNVLLLTEDDLYRNNVRFK